MKLFFKLLILYLISVHSEISIWVLLHSTIFWREFEEQEDHLAVYIENIRKLEILMGNCNFFPGAKDVSQHGGLTLALTLLMMKSIVKIN